MAATSSAATHSNAAASSSSSLPSTKGPSSSSSPSSSSKAAPALSEPVTLTAPYLATFRPAKVYSYSRKPDSQITSLCYDDRGQLVLSSSSDETLHIYDCITGKHVHETVSNKYGCHLARFTHHSSSVIYASTKQDETIRYHSVHHNSYLQYFRGHTGKVVGLEMSPVDDTFLSAAVDDSVRLWDLRSPTSQGHLNLKGHPVVAYDLTGKVFAIALNQRSAILLYDTRKFDQAPFLTIHLDDTRALSQISMPPRYPIITSLEFNNEGGHLLVGTSGDVHYVVDSFSGAILHRLVGHSGLENASGAPIGMVPEAGISGAEVCWTSDGKLVLAGSANGQIVVWKIPDEPQQQQQQGQQGYPAGGDIPNLNPTTVIPGHEGPVRCLAFSPRLAQLTTGSSQLVLWLPEPPSDI
ncbi:uncharacterized protein PFL1_02068 [Pseudozyma flocculosa PF-1]|uniref:Related to SWD2 - subunit of the COMPASS complex n=1 Tax=Pseudozyma flocculosa TaxID=84751 RepID=A0A5C3EZD6_9BASI|nr:uncharacterized protein PFL1_02068 [Pseudozyma flocculosa PF-1]EPQ30543.1 hypothetical protein PFL1_02068 [Pseudozyma flocculosa PF-1]SPO37634.1 related to SWD2 - subunit of the COMPASS complex [Pseudozyma flocculosa]